MCAQRERADSGRGEFDRQRHAVEAAADVCDGGRIVVGGTEVRAGPDEHGR